LMEPVRTCQIATHFKKVKDPESGDMLWTPCAPGARGATEMGLMDVKEGELYPPKIGRLDFERALASSRPSVGAEDLKEYEKFTEEFGQGMQNGFSVFGLFFFVFNSWDILTMKCLFFCCLESVSYRGVKISINQSSIINQSINQSMSLLKLNVLLSESNFVHSLCRPFPVLFLSLFLSFPLLPLPLLMLHILL
jgi:hypothetical protein